MLSQDLIKSTMNTNPNMNLLDFYNADDLAAIIKVENTELLSIRRDINSEGAYRTVIEVRPTPEYRHRCPKCGRTCQHYDYPNPSRGPKEFRSLPLGDELTFLSYQPERVLCPEHGVITADYPWAYPNSSFTKSFDRMVTYVAQKTSISGTAEVMKISWKTVGRCIDRVVAVEEPNPLGRYENLKRLGIDENYVGNGTYLMIVFNHENGEVIWIGIGRSPETLSGFFEDLTEEQRQKIEIVTCDGAAFIHDVVVKYCPNAKICMDTFHVFQWLTEDANNERLKIMREKKKLIDELGAQRKELKDELKGLSREEIKKSLKHYDIAIQKLHDETSILHKDRELFTSNKDNLSPKDLMKRENFLSIDPKLRTMAEKIDSFRDVFNSCDLYSASKKFDQYVSWSKRTPSKFFNGRSKTLEKFKDKIMNTIKYKITNGKVEATNNTIKALKRQAYGFRNMDNLCKRIKVRCSLRYKNLIEPYKGTYKSDWVSYKSTTLFANNMFLVPS